MTRAYTAEPVDAVVVDEILDLARRGPSAGKTDSLQFLVLNGADVARYWDTTLPVDTRLVVSVAPAPRRSRLGHPVGGAGCLCASLQRSRQGAHRARRGRTPGRCRTGGSTGAPRP